MGTGLPGNALKTARLEHDLGIPASYYFRAVQESWDEAIIQKIAGLGHEIRYHYENLSACKGNPDKAWKDFQANLAKLRKLAPVTTICMHAVKSTLHLMDLAWQGLLPDRIMINTHPQRWEDRPLPWLKELVWQNTKNVAKKILVKLKP